MCLVIDSENYSTAILNFRLNDKYWKLELLFVFQRTDSEFYTHCDGQQSETLQHKFCDCARPGLDRLAAQAGGRNEWLEAAILRGPRETLALAGVNTMRRLEILILFVKYICFVNECNGRTDVSELNFHLDKEFKL